MMNFNDDETGAAAVRRARRMMRATAPDALRVLRDLARSSDADVARRARSALRRHGLPVDAPGTVAPNGGES